MENNKIIVENLAVVFDGVDAIQEADITCIRVDCTYCNIKVTAIITRNNETNAYQCTNIVFLKESSKDDISRIGNFLERVGEDIYYMLK